MNAGICYILAFLIGIGLSVQVGLNTQLRTALGSPIMAAIISFIVGTLLLIIYALIFERDSFNSLSGLRTVSWYKCAGGLMGAFYIAGIILLAPRIGVTSITALVVGGQLLFALLLDHYGLFDFAQYPINSLRILGACLLMVGVMLILRN